MPPVRKALLIFLGLVSSGCTADAYRRQADAQVNSILRDREEKTLGYTPKVEAKTSVPEAAPKSAYAKIPMTPLPPAMPARVEPTDVEFVYGPLGPEMKWPPGVKPPSPEDFQLEVSLEGGNERLRLGPPAPGDETIRLDLFKALAYGAEHSRTYQNQMEDVYLAALDVTLQRHLFEPRPFAETGVEYTGSQEDANYRSAFSVTNSVGFRQQLPYGGDITARALVNFVNAISGNVEDGEQAGVAISAAIPLLRGAGMVNLERLIDSERQVVYEIRAYESFRRSFVVNVASSYFRLLSQQQSIANRQQSLQSLRLLTQKSRRLFAAGLRSRAQMVTFIDVQRSLQSQLSTENNLIESQADYQSSLDEFKISLGIPTEQKIDVVAELLDVTVPEYSVDEAVKMAHMYRLELQTAKDRVEDAQRGINFAKNGLLPDLDFTADGRLTNDRPSSNDPTGPSYDIRGDTATYGASIRLGLPLDRVAERNAYRRALIRLERAQRDFELLRDVVSADARDAVRGIESARATLRIQQNGIDLAQRRLENSNELLRQGKIDNRELVEAQSDLLEAQDDFEQARANLQIQILRFLRDTGTLRVDPSAGSIGHAMTREAVSINDRPERR